MKKLPLILLVLGLICLVMGFTVTGPSIDIPIHDTYIVIGMFQFTIPVAIVFIFFGLVYWFFMSKRKLKNWLIWVHLGGSFVVLTLFYLAPLFFIGSIPRYNDSYESLNQLSTNVNSLILLLVILFIILQFIPFINFYISKKR